MSAFEYRIRMVPFIPSRSASAPTLSKKTGDSLKHVQIVRRPVSTPPGMCRRPSILKCPPTGEKKRKESGFILEEYFPHLVKRRTPPPVASPIPAPEKDFLEQIRNVIAEFVSFTGDKKCLLIHNGVTPVTPILSNRVSMFHRFAIVDAKDTIPNSRYVIKVPKAIGYPQTIFQNFLDHMKKEDQLRQYVDEHSIELTFTEIIDWAPNKNAGFIKKYEAGLPIANTVQSIPDINKLLALAVDPEFRKLKIIIELTKESGLFGIDPQKNTPVIYWGDVICEEPNQKDQIVVIERSLKAFLTTNHPGQEINLSHFNQLTSGMAAKDPSLIPILEIWEQNWNQA